VSEVLFNQIAEKFTEQDTGVILGKMMSAPGLKVNNKVFAFYSKGGMGFRLGGNFDIEKFGISTAKPLSPFKTKPPLKGWYIIESTESNLWETLAEMALQFTKTIIANYDK